METLTYTVPGMSCDHCKEAVHDGISTVPGVAEVSVDLDTKRVDVTGDGLDDATIRAAIEDEGYEASRVPR